MRQALVGSLLLALAAAPAGAQPSKTWAKQLADELRPRPAGVSVQVDVTESKVSASDLDDYIAKVNALAARGSATTGPGASSWRISWPWATETQLSECRFRKVEVSMRYAIDVTMLDGPVAADTAAQRWWTAATDSIYRSHLERIRIIRDGGRQMYRAMRNLTNSSCAMLMMQANATALEQLKGMQERMAAAGAPVGVVENLVQPPE